MAGWVEALRSTNPGTPIVTAGNIIGNGTWELPANFSAAVIAASQFDVMVSCSTIKYFRKGGVNKYSRKHKSGSLKQKSNNQKSRKQAFLVTSRKIKLVALKLLNLNLQLREPSSRS